MFKFTRFFATKATPQREPIPGSHQVPNSAGGFTWRVDDWARLDRFLILGSEGGTYYISEHKLTVENAEAVRRCITADGVRTVDRIVAISDAGRAPRNDPAIFALAMAAKLGDERTRRAAYAALPKVCRIGTHLMHFADYAQGFGGWGRGMRKAVGAWFNAKPAADLAFQLAKYQSRDGWSNRDLLRLAHPRAASPSHDRLFAWAVKGELPEAAADDPALALIVAMAELAKTTDVKAAAKLIRDARIPRECVPTQLLVHAEIWDALAAAMPMTAMIRNLATMTRVGLIAPGSAATRRIAEQLTDARRLAGARVHPIAVLAALLTYRSGHGARGGGTWSPVAQIADALDTAFYASFGFVEAAGKRMLLDGMRRDRRRAEPDAADRQRRDGAGDGRDRAQLHVRRVLDRAHDPVDLAAPAARRRGRRGRAAADGRNRLRLADALGAAEPRRCRHVLCLHRQRDLGGQRAPGPGSAGIPRRTGNPGQAGRGRDDVERLQHC